MFAVATSVASTCSPDVAGGRGRQDADDARRPREFEAARKEDPVRRRVSGVEDLVLLVDDALPDCFGTDGVCRCLGADNGRRGCLYFDLQ